MNREVIKAHHQAAAEAERFWRGAGRDAGTEKDRAAFGRLASHYLDVRVELAALLAERAAHAEDLIAAAVAAEAWFTRAEVTDTHNLNHEAYKVADALRAALKHVEDEAPEVLRTAEAKARELFPHG